MIDSKDKIIHKPINFGKIITTLLDNPDVTDIEIRPTADELAFALWTVNATKGRSRYDLNSASDDEVEELRMVIDNLPSQLQYDKGGTDYSPTAPVLDADLIYKNDSIIRINCIHEILTGSDYIPMIAIRKSPYQLRLTKDYMIKSNYVDEKFFDLMKVLVEASCNIMIAGLVGSGKTSLLKFLVQYIKDDESIITIEDTREAFLERLYPDKETGSLMSNNKEEKTKFENLINYCLRQNMQWIVVSEIRGRAVSDLMDAVGTGHNLISTVHADGVDDIPFRMVNMAKADGATSQRLYDQIYRDINIGIHIHYYNDKKGSHRQLKEICEYYVDEKGKPQTHLIYYYDEKDECFKTDKIKSKKIMNKIIRKKINYNKIKEWIDEQ